MFKIIDDLDLSTGNCYSGFVPAGRVGTFDLSSGYVYKLTNFFGSRSKFQYRVADHSATVSFSWNSSLSVLENPPVLFPVDRFRFHSYESLGPTVTLRVIFMVRHVELIDTFVKL